MIKFDWRRGNRALAAAETTFLGGSELDTNEDARDIASMSFEDALLELETIVRRLEEGTAKLDEAIAAYERGAALKRHCERKLEEAKARVDTVIAGSDGQLSAEPARLD